jgi:hypothetical protein
MSDCSELPEENRRTTQPRKVKFTVHNPNARLSQRAIEAIARLLLSTEDKPLVEPPLIPRPGRSCPKGSGKADAHHS